MIEELGVDAVMVGRAAMNNPYIFHANQPLLRNRRGVARASI